ncbi:TonB dependent receptor [compost metagenome]
MRSKFKWIFALLLAFSMQFSFAQEKTISGTITDSQGLPLPGVSVVVKGTTRGTQTDFDGKYSIAAKQGEVLEFTYVGSKTSTVTVGASSSVNVTMVEDSTVLDVVVVDSYRTTSKRKSAVAATTVTAEAVQGRPNVSFLQSLQSQVAGLNIATSSGSPGTVKIDIILRGLSSVNGHTEPLFVIDGVPANQNVFRGLNNEDIENITVLKDAGATAIYGNRGANGVILVKTKKGSYNSKLTVRYSGSTGFMVMQDEDYDLTNAQNTLLIENRAGRGRGASMSLEQIAGYNSPLTPELAQGLTPDQIRNWGVNTDWKDYFFRTGITKSHNLSFSQGSENVSNFTSFSYFEQEGVLPTTDFKRFTFRTNFTGKSSNEKFTYSTNFTGSFSRRNQIQQETTSALNANVVQNPLQGSLASLPYINPLDYRGSRDLFDTFGTGDFTVTPLILLDYLQEGKIPNRYDEIKILANASGTYKFNDNFSFTTTAGIDYNNSDRIFARNPNSWLAIAATPAGAEYGGIELQSRNRDFAFNFVNKLEYSKTFNDKHTLGVAVFSEYIKANADAFQYQQTGLDPRTWSLGQGSGYIPFNPLTPNFYQRTSSATKAKAGLFSYFASADYDYDSKYGIEATIRRDGSYKFVSDNTWGTFWSVSARWNIDQESFMENSGFDMLKLRGSYGTTGNQNIEAVALGGNALYASNALVRALNSSQTGYMGLPSLGVAVDPNGNPLLGNPLLKWETTAQANIGIDFTFKKRLSGTIDVYRKETKDLFDTNYISAINTVYTMPANTRAKLLNSGVEVLLRYDLFTKGDFKMDLFVNGSYNKNEMKNLIYPDGEDVIFLGNVAHQNGAPIYSYYLVPYIGVNPENGNMLFLDRNNNPTEDPTDEDRRLMDKNQIPKYQGGFGLNASYKGFFVNSSFSFVKDIYRFDFDLNNMSNPINIGNFPVVSDLLNAWTPENPNSNVPRLDAPTANIAAADISDKFLKDASYIRLKNLVVGYDVPAKLLDRTMFKNVKVYTQLENYFTWSKWRGYDVEGLNASNQGGYPAPKAISFGVDLQF